MTQTNILLVDDNEDALAIGALMLEEAGYNVVPSPDSDIALVLLQESVPFELLVTDIILPGRLDGFGLAHEARCFLPQIAVLYTTGFADVARIRSRGNVYGDVLSKPFKGDALLRAVRIALRARAAA